MRQDEASLERKLFPPMPLLHPSFDKKPDPPKDGILIKKDYLPSPARLIKQEVQKTRESVTRILDFGNETNCNNKMITSPASPSPPAIKIEVAETTDKEDRLKIDEQVESGKAEISTVKIEIKSEKTESLNDKPTKHNANDSHHDNSHHKSSSRRSSTSSSRDCSKCYKRSKIKRFNVGVQCKRGMPSVTQTPSKIPNVKRDHHCGAISVDHLKYGRFFRVEVHPNGGASTVHLYQDELDTLSRNEYEELVNEFFQFVFSEDENGNAYHVMGIVHDAASYIPDLLEHFAENYPTLTVKAGVLGHKSDIETCTMSQYNEQVEKNYSHGTFRYGPLHQISLVGKVQEEVGGYFPDLLERLEKNPFLNKVNH